MYTISTRTAAVTGARHLAAARNGQDAAASWVGEGMAAIAVCDGCGAGAGSEVGARLGAQLVVRAIAARLERGDAAAAVWAGVQDEVLAVFAGLGFGEAALHDHLLFTIVAAAMVGDEVCVWAIGDGCYAVDDRVVALGPFEGNRPPYLAYALLGMPIAAHVEACRGARIAVATDGIEDLRGLLHASVLAHPDGLRRRLAVMARAGERIDWEARRVVRTPAALVDDGAVAVAWRTA